MVFKFAIDKTLRELVTILTTIVVCGFGFISWITWATNTGEYLEIQPQKLYISFAVSLIGLILFRIFTKNE